ncbi:MAG: hypothetical protein ACU84Q_12710 [Gammaproteobacteria bacterium]
MITTPKFASLAVVSILTSAMLFVDGRFSRLAALQSGNSASIEQSQNMAFWQLWVPLLLVQIVLVVLVRRAQPTTVQRNIIYLGIFLFVIATLYSITGFHILTRTLA